MAIPFKYDYNNECISSIYPEYNCIQYYYESINNPRIRFINFNNNINSHIMKEYFEDADITIINCCKELANSVYYYGDIVDYEVNVADKYIHAILNDDYKMSVFDFYNDEIKKGLLMYITNVFKNYPVFCSNALDKKVIDMLLQMIRNGCCPKIEAETFDKYIDLANENSSAQDIAELLEFRHKHYGNSFDEDRFDL